MMAVVLVSAINAKTLEVKFNKAVDTDKAVFEVKKGTVKVNVAEKTFADDMQSVQLELASKLFEGEYTVNVTGLTDEALTGSVEVVNEKVEKIEMLSETAPIATAKTATVGYRVLNQYGEDVTKAPIASNIDWNASTGYKAADDNKGVITISSVLADGNAGPDLKVDNKVVVTGINAATNTVVTGTITITDAAVADIVTFKDVYHADGKELAGDSTASEFKLLIEAKDQYGNPVKAARVNNDILFTSSNESLVKVTTANDDQGKDKDQIGLDIVLGANKATGGTATITAISKSTGKVSQYQLTVKATAKLDVFSMTAPAEIVAAGDTVKIPFTATDQFGKEITKAKDLTDVTFSGTFGAAGSLVIKDDAKGVAYLEYKPATKGTKVIIATFNGKVSQLSLNVVEKANPVTIESLKDVTTTVAKNGTTTIELKNLVIKDEYGRTVDLKGELTATENAGSEGKYKIVAADTTTDPQGAVKVNTAVITADAGKIIIEGVAKGSEVVTFTLEEVKKQADNSYKFEEVSTSALKVTFNTVEKAAFASYEVGEIGKVYNNVDTHAQELKVYGVTESGSKVLLPKSDYTVIVDTDLLQYNKTNDGKLRVKEGNVSTTAPSPFKDTDEVKTNVQVIVDAAETPVTLTKEVVISKALPKAGSIEIVKDELAGVTIDGKNVIMANAPGAAVDKTDLLQLIEVEDQYGEAIATPAPKITFTNVKDTDGKSVTRTIASNGTENASINSLVAGDSFKVTFVLDGKTLTIDVKVNAVTAKRALTIAAPTLTKTKIYDGTTAAAVTAGALTGKVAGDDVSVATAVATYDNKNVGTGKTITVVYTLTGTDAAKYSLANTVVTDGVITAKELTIAGLSASYTPAGSAGAGTVNITGTPSLVGVVGTEDVSINGTASGSISGATSSEAVTITGLTLTGNDASNYSLTVPTDLTVDATTTNP